MKKYLICFLMIVLIQVVTIYAGPGRDTGGGGPVSLEFWSSLTGARVNTFDDQVAQFNAREQNASVNVIHQGGYNIVRHRMAAAANARALPQLVIVDYIDVAGWAQMGLLYPVSNILPRELVNDYYPSMLIDLYYEGDLYAIPYNRSTQAMFVNNDLLREAGLSGPARTWQQFESDARTLRQRLGTDYYYGYAFFHQFLFDAISLSWNAAISSPDGRILLNSPEQIAMMEYFQRLHQERLLLMQPVLVGGFQEQHGAFLDGRVASVFQTTSFLPVADDMLDSDWSMEYMPAGPAGNAITIGGGNIALTSGVNNNELDAARRFLEHMSSPDLVAQFFIQTGNIPVRQSVMQRNDIQSILRANPSARVMMDQLQFGRPVPSLTKNLGDVFNRVNDIISLIILEGRDARTVLNEYTRQFQLEFDELIANGEFIF